MRNLKNYMVIALMFCMVMCAESQEKIAVAVYQDLKLLTVGDNIGNSAGTINIISQFKMQGKQQKHGYLIVFPEFEYAALKGGDYLRYSVNVGYVFNKYIKRVETGLNFGWGWIDRQNFTFSNLAISGNVNYKITENLKLTALAQLTDRADLEKPVVRASGFLGLEINLN